MLKKELPWVYKISYQVEDKKLTSYSDILIEFCRIPVKFYKNPHLT